MGDMRTYGELRYRLLSQGDLTYRDFLWSEADEDSCLQLIRENPEELSLIARNKRLPASVIRVLAVHPDADVRSCIAMKGRAPGDVLAALAEDPEEAVRDRVACNAKAPIGALERLAKDPAPTIRRTAGERLAAILSQAAPAQ